MNKTPVSMLQEMMVKKSMTPSYELIHNGGGTHVNTFTYQVTCDGLTATGSGRCKKAAKHDAANAMLEAIAAHRAYPQLPASPAQSPIRTPVPPTLPPSMPFRNAVGALQDLCSEHTLEDPAYIFIDGIGPAHAKLFKYQCVVSTFREEGEATTKKQAKHEAAKKMLDRINDLLSTRSTDELRSSLCSNESKEPFANDIVKTRYLQLTKLPLTKKVNLGLKLADYHTKLKASYEEGTREEIITKLQELKCRHNQAVEPNSLLAEFKEILLNYNLNLEDGVMTCYESNTHATVLQIDTFPAITEIAIESTLEKAQISAAVKLIDCILFFLK